MNECQQTGLARRIARPPAVIGILGGGQLGRMMALAARSMGYGVRVLDPASRCPARVAADGAVTAPFDSVQAARELARQCDVLTYEFENVPAEIVTALEQESWFPQGGEALRISQDRLREKQALREAGFETAAYRPVTSFEELQEAADEIGLPAILKTCRGGYDGKGQVPLRTGHDLQRLHGTMDAGGHWILEKWVPFQCELSVLVARGSQGETRSFPVVKNVHRSGILHRTTAPAALAPQQEARVQQWAQALAGRLRYVGILAVELFYLKDGTMVANEMAPRPHNSGHWTLDGCSVSQFEQHIRAVTGLPLAEPVVTRPTVMLNVLGQHYAALLAGIDTLPANCFVHIYGKDDVRPGRKMAHINCTGTNAAEARESARLAEELLQMEADHE